MGIMTYLQIHFVEFDDGGRRGHSKKLFKRRNRLDIRKYVFANRIVDKWNVLPDSYSKLI